MIFTERVDIVHPVSGTVLSEGERANVLALSSGLITGDGWIAAERRLVMQLSPDTLWENGYRVRWLGVHWTADGELLPIRRRGKTLYQRLPVKRYDGV